MKPNMTDRWSEGESQQCDDADIMSISNTTVSLPPAVLLYLYVVSMTSILRSFFSSFLSTSAGPYGCCHHYHSVFVGILLLMLFDMTVVSVFWCLVNLE